MSHRFEGLSGVLGKCSSADCGVCYCLRAGRREGATEKREEPMGFVTSTWNEGVNVPGQKLD